MSFKVKDDVTREQLVRLVEALHPFYGFGAVLETANEDNGYANVTLYAGKAAVTKENPHGVKYSEIPEPEEFENEVELAKIDPDGCLLGVAGGWHRVAASYMGPVLRAKHFFEARKAFLECIEEDKDGKSGS